MATNLGNFVTYGELNAPKKSTVFLIPRDHVRSRDRLKVKYFFPKDISPPNVAEC